MTKETATHPTIIVLTPDFPPELGGIQTLVHRVSQGFSRFRPRVITISSGGAADFDRQQSFEIIRVTSPAGHRSEVLALNARAIVEGLRARPSAVFSAHITTGPAALIVGALIGRPVVQLVHAQELVRRPTLARNVLRRADAIIAPSAYSESLVNRATGQRTQVHIVHPGVDAPTKQPSPRMDRKAIVVVSRLAERYKGHDVLLQALKLVLYKLPTAHLDIVGDGPLRGELESLAQKLGVAEATTFHGSVGDAQRDSIIRDATVFAMPSRIDAHGAGEGFGIVYVEAGAYGLPVVCGNAGGALDAVVDGETGLLVDAESPEAVANALCELLLDQPRAQALGRAGWEHARSLSWHRTASEVEAVLDEVTAA